MVKSGKYKIIMDEPALGLGVVHYADNKGLYDRCYDFSHPSELLEFIMLKRYAEVNTDEWNDNGCSCKIFRNNNEVCLMVQG